MTRQTNLAEEIKEMPRFPIEIDSLTDRNFDNTSQRSRTYSQKQSATGLRRRAAQGLATSKAQLSSKNSVSASQKEAGISRSKFMVSAHAVAKRESKKTKIL